MLEVRCLYCLGHFQSGTKRGVPAAPPPPIPLIQPGLSLPWPWASLSLPASPGPLTSGITLRLPAPPVRIYVTLGVALNPALSNLLSWSW